jgi:regulator of replication initiation timing
VNKIGEALHEAQIYHYEILPKQENESVGLILKERKEKEDLISIVNEVSKMSMQLRKQQNAVRQLRHNVVDLIKERDELTTLRDEYKQRLDDLDKCNTCLYRENCMKEHSRWARGSVNNKFGDNSLPQSEVMKATRDNKSLRSDLCTNCQAKLQLKTDEYNLLLSSESLTRTASTKLQCELVETRQLMEDKVDECKQLSSKTQEITEKVEMQEIRNSVVNDHTKKCCEELKLTHVAQSSIAADKSNVQRKYVTEQANTFHLQKSLEEDLSSKEMFRAAI